MLRQMTSADIPAVLAIEQATQISPWIEQAFIESLQVYSCWVIEQNNAVIAFGIISIKKSVGESHIMDIAVKPEKQGQGLGKQLLLHLLYCAEIGGGYSVLLEVRRSNVKALQLYKALGFNEIGVRKNYYPAVNGREDAIMLGFEIC